MTNDRNGYYDPDPAIISIGTIIAITIIGAVIGGTSMAIQRPSFFDHILMIIDPSIKEMAEEELNATKEFWRMVFIVVLVIACIVGLILWWRYSERRKHEKNRWKRR